MPLLRLVAEGVGPFDRIDLDLSDGKGNPHLGPHILAGVNGSGKSTILRTIAWILDRGELGFPQDEWRHLTAGYQTRALAVVKLPEFDPFALSSATAGAERFEDWVKAQDPAAQNRAFLPYSLLVAAYSPSRNLRYIRIEDSPRPSASHRRESLSFEKTVQNDAVQNWLLSLYSRRAIAESRDLPTEEYTESLGKFEVALSLLYGGDVSFHVELKPFEPRLRVKGRSLNFSQLPDGIRATVGWIADFMMRQDCAGSGQPSLLLLDEIDAHLHPLWQRKLLPAIRKALPDVQIIVTSHSPFVISSCQGARVHVLDLDERGKAHNRTPIDAPIGESVQTTLSEIFGVDSRFDVQTEADLNEWNGLKKKEAVGKLAREEAKRLLALTQILSERSEELKSIVASPMTIPGSVLKSLAGAPHKKRKTG